MPNRDAENSEKPSHHSRAGGVLAFALVAVLWIGLGFGLKSAWAQCTAYFQANGITMIGGVQSAGTASLPNSNYNYYTFCTVFDPSTGAQTSPGAITWTTSLQTTLYKQTWKCSYNGHNDTYFPINCTWQSNITAFWLTPAPGQQNKSLLILR